MLQMKKNTIFKRTRNNSDYKSFNNEFIKKSLKAALLLGIICLTVSSILKIITPVKPFRSQILSAGIYQGQIQKPQKTTIQSEMKNSIRDGLFKPSRHVNANSITDKTVERIFSSLKLQSVMPIGGNKVAYIVLKDGQMRKCKIGDTVKDMFTVTDIQDNTVSIDILGHKLKLTR